MDGTRTYDYCMVKYISHYNLTQTGIRYYEAQCHFTKHRALYINYVEVYRSLKRQPLQAIGPNPLSSSSCINIKVLLSMNALEG